MSELIPQNPGLDGERLELRYDERYPPVIDGESLQILPGKITALIGANGSGKSTLLKALARQLQPESGRVILDGHDIATLAPRRLAQKLGILFQEHVAPGDLTVEELIYHGRYPHRGLFESLTPEDHAAVEDALRMSGLEAIRHRPMNQLSGGQRQLAWIAMALAQSPAYLLLDEPTTFLDPAHQFDVMDLIFRLNRERGKTIVLVVHDLNLAARYADYLFALHSGRIVASGPPARVLTVDILREVFEVETEIVRDHGERAFFCIPISRARPK
jgi:iron complex transport system ATP-binding protein